LSSAPGGTVKLMGDRASMQKMLDRAITSIWMAYQPIVNWQTREVIAYEALVRTDDPDLPYPDALLSAAKRLGRIEDVSRAIRARVARDLSEHPRTGDVFVNLHPADLLDERLYSTSCPMAAHAQQIVLEITEREALDDMANIPARAKRLRKLGYRIAIDDLGAGYSGLDYFARLTPEVAKIDISLVRDIHNEKIKQKLVGSLITLCKELGVTVVAEGVETAAERDTLAALGCDRLQGYLFAKPGKPYPPATL
jgi:EAL domain-containing protein (putative c-di-GMP-specific phosphodiesterase class I)